MLPCSLWPLLALALGGSPHAPHPHFGAPPPHGHEDPQGLFYDHAALWGAQEAREQRELPPEEAQRRLGLLVALMDADSSGLLSRQELRAWILRRHRGSRQEALASESARLDRDSDGAVTWAEFSAESFGESEDFGGSPDPDSHRKLLERSRRRFRAADEDGDGRLQAAELEAFLNPEDFARLQDLVVQETIEDLDRDGDGFVQVDEYIADLFEGPPGSPEPPKIQREREQKMGSADSFQAPPSPKIQREREQKMGSADSFQAPPSPKIQREREQKMGSADLFEGPPGSPEPPEIQREREQKMGSADSFQAPPSPKIQREREQKMGSGSPEPPEIQREREQKMGSADLFEGPPGSPEPPEIQREREQFLQVRDQDRDGRLGPAEVKLWLSPPSPDWAGVEAEHLIHHADQNQDGALSREEILGRWELFVGSRATDYGQDLHRGHDEL